VETFDTNTLLQLATLHKSLLMLWRVAGDEELQMIAHVTLLGAVLVPNRVMLEPQVSFTGVHGR
jgi:hypothetical protein